MAILSGLFRRSKKQPPAPSVKVKSYRNVPFNAKAFYEQHTNEFGTMSTGYRQITQGDKRTAEKFISTPFTATVVQSDGRFREYPAFALVNDKGEFGSYGDDICLGDSFITDPDTNNKVPTRFITPAEAKQKADARGNVPLKGEHQQWPIVTYRCGSTPISTIELKEVLLQLEQDIRRMHEFAKDLQDYMNRTWHLGARNPHADVYQNSKIAVPSDYSPQYRGFHMNNQNQPEMYISTPFTASHNGQTYPVFVNTSKYKMQPHNGDYIQLGVNPTYIEGAKRVPIYSEFKTPNQLRDIKNDWSPVEYAYEGQKVGVNTVLGYAQALRMNPHQRAGITLALNAYGHEMQELAQSAEQSVPESDQFEDDGSFSTYYN